MKNELKQLRKLKGVGAVLAKRFFEAGYDTFDKIASAHVEDLKKIPGVNPNNLQQIVAQAGTLAEEASKSRDEKIAELKHRAASLKSRINDLTINVRERFSEKVSGKAAGKVEKEIRKFILSLERVEGKLESRVKKAGKGLRKAESRITGLADGGLKKITVKLKKARKSLKRVYA